MSNTDNLNFSTAAAVVHERTRLLAASGGNSRSNSNNTSHNGTPTSSRATAKHRYYGKQLSQGNDSVSIYISILSFTQPYILCNNSMLLVIQNI
jgi:hypothetical protein